MKKLVKRTLFVVCIVLCVFLFTCKNITESKRWIQSVNGLDSIQIVTIDNDTVVIFEKMGHVSIVPKNYRNEK